MAKLKTADYTKRLETARTMLEKKSQKGTPEEVRKAKKHVKRAQRGIKRIEIAAKHASRHLKKSAAAASSEE